LCNYATRKDIFLKNVFSFPKSNSIRIFNTKQDLSLLSKIFLPIFLSLLFASCDNGDRPLDADVKQRIDSLSNVRIREAKAELDTLCRNQHITLLPELIDSIKKERKIEIEEALRSIPK
jgi:hypothetical protein